MRRLLATFSLAALFGCPTKQEPLDGGQDLTVDGGIANAPLDRVFSIGITDNAEGPPQGAPLVNLKFGEGTPGPTTVVSLRRATPPTLDGLDSDWASIPGSVVSVQPR